MVPGYAAYVAVEVQGICGCGVAGHMWLWGCRAYVAVASPYREHIRDVGAGCRGPDDAWCDSLIRGG